MTAPIAPAPLALVKASAIAGLPVVDVSAGEALADIRDVVYDPEQGRLTGFTLNQRGGLFAGPMKQTLSLASTRAIGRDAVTVTDAGAIGATAAAAPAGTGTVDTARNVLGNQVLTDAGERLGEVTDLIVEAGIVGRGGADEGIPGTVVGYEVAGDPALQGHDGAPLLIPLPYTLAVSGTNLVVPAAVQPFIRDDLSGFGAAVKEFRSRLGPPEGLGAGSAEAGR